MARAATTTNRTKTARPRRTSKPSAEKSPPDFTCLLRDRRGPDSVPQGLGEPRLHRVPRHQAHPARAHPPGSRKHHQSLFDLPAALYERAFRTARTLAAPLGKYFDVPRVGIVVEGFGVAHAHIHLVPISEAGQLNPALASEASAEDLQRMRAALARVLKTRT